MTQANFPLASLDIAEERRRALAKIYSLLMKLAEKAEKSTTSSETISEEEKVVEPTAPLKENIPPSEV